VADFDLNALMQQAQQLQQKLREMQDATASKVVTAEAGGGMVRVTADGSMAVHTIRRCSSPRIARCCRT